MARKPRIDYPGAVHHVMNRGADHQIVFRNNDDRQLFLTLWAQAVARFGIVVLSFCLMDNHFHVVVVSPEGQLSRTLQFIGRAYTQRFNRAHSRDGALFRGRFHSVLVDSKNYLDRLVRYVELNPVNAGICTLDDLDRYGWSSFQFYVGGTYTPQWLSTDRVLESFASRQQFDRFVRSAAPDSVLEAFFDKGPLYGRVLGDQSFVDQVAKTIEQPADLTAGLGQTPIEDVSNAVIRLSGCGPAELQASTPGKKNVARSVAVDVAHRATGATLAELADAYGFKTVASVHYAIRSSRISAEPGTIRLRNDTLAEIGRDSDGQRLG